ncbi:MAG: OmpA family protein [Methylococcales bacterium]|nr:OmpA family protein [Methylococcales bacterium]
MSLTKLASAEDINFGKQTPSANQVIDALTPTEPSPVDADDQNAIGKSRSIDMSVLDATPASHKKKVKKEIHKAVQKANREAALSMEILFGFKSAELTATAKDQLKPVGEAMASEKLQHLDFVVEGHTDAVGSSAYNKVLSEERADAVKRFLVDTFRIDASRIRIVGKGKSDLLDPKNPGSEVNRRVRIIAKK